ncbi:MAG TPA: hypothetical protein VN442_03690 [Bryobacteraceae bacterium]|nr:hypothetical protein [Bryobacteraceae bacterium]
MIRAATLVCLLVAPLFGGFVRMWSPDELAQAAVLAVARVESVTEGPPVRPELVRWRVPTKACTANLRVLRAFKGDGSRAVRLHFYCYGPVRGGLSQGDPEFPSIEKGQVFLFPLAGARLVGEEGRGLIVPAVETAPEGPAPASGREFITRELANALLRGPHVERYRVGLYLQAQTSQALPDDLMSRLSAVLKPGDPRWLDIAASQLATMGIPRQPLPATGGPLAARAWAQVKSGQRTEDLIRSMLRHSDVDEWGSAATLIPEYKDHPLLLGLLPEYLAKGHRGSLYIAWWAVRNGQPAVLPAALPASLQALRNGKGIVNDLYAASSLLVDHGNDEQFAEFLALFRAAGKRDPKLYSTMWQAPFVEKGARLVRMLAVLLADERIFTDDMGYCDLAGGQLERLAGQKFGFTYWNQDLASRNAALARARRWMATSSAPR